MWIKGWGHLPGQLIVVSGPSGSGKSTILRRALGRPEVRARLSISATTREARQGEVHGVHYLFLDPATFETTLQRGEFLEYADYNQRLYGTPAAPVFEAMRAGECVILEIEVKGAIQVREKAPLGLFIFIDVPRFADLEARLRSRGTEDETSIHRRLVRARWERENAHWYDYRVINDDLDRAVEEFVGILSRSGCGG